MGVTINKKSTTKKQNHRLRTDSSLSHRVGGGGLNAFYGYQIFALDSVVVEVQEMFSSHGGHLTYAMYHQGDDDAMYQLTLINLSPPYPSCLVHQTINHVSNYNSCNSQNLNYGNLTW